MTDAIGSSLGPAVLDGIGEVKTQLGKANGDLEALIESISPADTNVKRHVILRLQHVGDAIERAFDHLDNAEQFASGTVDPEASL